MEKSIEKRESSERIHFVTGRLAEFALRQIVEEISKEIRFEYTIGVMPITVAALMTPRWLRRHLSVPPNTSRAVLPGYCREGLEEIAATLNVPVQCGPKDLRELPKFFSLSGKKVTLDQYNIEIIAEINHAPNLAISELQAQGNSLREQGADVVDVGCNPGTTIDQILARPFIDVTENPFARNAMAANSPAIEPPMMMTRELTA